MIVALVVRQFVPNNRKALRTAIAVSMGGEFGFALLTLLLRGDAVDDRIVQALLTAVALSMLLGPAARALQRPHRRLDPAPPTGRSPPTWRSRPWRRARSRGAST